MDDSFGVRSLGSAASQGGQDTFPEHTNGSHITGWDTSAQASRGTLPIMVVVADKVTSLHMQDNISPGPVQQCPQG